jgi:hypothetical protein
MTKNYPPPIDKLLTLGNAWNMRDWPDYLALGLGPEHIPDLIRMATDDELNDGDSESPDVWAPAHAWRALGQLRAAEASAPLVQLFQRVDDSDDDFLNEDLPEAFGLIGAAAIPALTAYLADPSHGLWARVAVGQSLKEIGLRHLEARDECVAVLTHQLEKFKEQDPDLNAYLISPLLDLHAVESAPLIERAFAAGTVDESVAGDWEDVQIELGLISKRTKPRGYHPLTPAEAELQRIAEGIARLSAGPISKEEKTQSKPKRHRHKKKAS